MTADFWFIRCKIAYLHNVSYLGWNGQVGSWKLEKRDFPYKPPELHFFKIYHTFSVSIAFPEHFFPKYSPSIGL
jgi:hypothetical protein